MSDINNLDNNESEFLTERPTKQQFFERYIHLTVSDDKMNVHLTYSIYPEEPIRVSDFINYLRQHHVVFGINEELLSEICLNPSKYSGMILEVAQGKLPEHGEDTTIKWNFHLPSFIQSDVDVENKNIDYKNVDNLINIKAGKLLAVKTPATEGISGMTVLGDRIKATPGRNSSIKFGKNVVLDQSGLKAYAVIDGQVTITEKDKINVFPIFEVKGDVDYSVGNIDFVGSVVIKGNVLAGFTVRAGGDIRIFGEVEGAELEAGGNVEIKAGIYGQGKGSVKAGHNVIANYINQANVSAKNDIIVSQSIMHSNVQADHKVSCIRNKGLIVGGRIQAGELIEANVFGNISQTPTILEVGVSPELIDEYNSIKDRIVQLETDLDKASKALNIIDRQFVSQRSLTEEKMILRNKLSNTVISIQKVIPELEQRRVELEQGLEMVNQAKIDVRSIAYPGTKLLFGKYVHYLKVEHSYISFRLEDGNITVKPL